MRRITFTAAAVGLLVLVALPAQAKVTGEATISGPGLGDGGGGGAITIDGSDGDGWAAFSGLLDVGAIGSERPPTTDLGPRYRVVLDIRQPFQRVDLIQYVYPYAGDRALIYTPPGQRLLDFEAPSGWFAASGQLIDLLEDAGLPAEKPTPATVLPGEPEPGAQPAEGVEPSIPPVVWAVVALGGLLLGGSIASRRRARVATG